MIKKAATLVFLAAAVVSGCQEPDLSEQDLLQGVVEFDERSLAFQAPGRVAALSVHRGDVVKADQVIAKLDDDVEQTVHAARVAEAEATQAQAALLEAGARPEEIQSMAARVKATKSRQELLEKTLEREKNLLARGVSTRSALDQVQSQLDSTRAERESLEYQLAALRRGARKQELDSARARVAVADKTVELEQQRLERRELRVPVAGTVLEVHVENGEVVSPGSPIVTLADTESPYVDVFVPIADLEGIRLGVPAKVRVDSISSTLDGKIDWISRTTEFTPRFLFSEQERPNLVVRVRVLVSDPERKLHAGVPAFVDFSASNAASPTGSR